MWPRLQCGTCLASLMTFGSVTDFMIGSRSCGISVALHLVCLVGLSPGGSATDHLDHLDHLPE